MHAPRIGLDIKILGGLFLIFGTGGLIGIALFSSYAFKLFGVAVTGPSSYLVKLHSPAVYLLIGYGFFWLRPWAWGLSLAYAGFGIVSEAMNQLTWASMPFGPASWPQPSYSPSSLSGGAPSLLMSPCQKTIRSRCHRSYPDARNRLA